MGSRRILSAIAVSGGFLVVFGGGKGILAFLHAADHHAGLEDDVPGLLDHLAVDGGVDGVHDDGVVGEVDLGIHAGVTDQVDDPLLPLLGREIETLRQKGDVDALVGSAVGLQDEDAGILEEVFAGGGEEEVIVDDILAFLQLGLGAVEVDVDVQGLDELSDGVLVGVGFLLDNFDQVLQDVFPTAANDGSGSDVTKDPRAGGLDGVDILGLEKHVEQMILAVLVVEEDEQRPVDKMRALVKELDRRGLSLKKFNKCSDGIFLPRSPWPPSASGDRCRHSPSFRTGSRTPTSPRWRKEQDAHQGTKK